MIKAAFPPAATASYIIPTPDPSAAARAWCERRHQIVILIGKKVRLTLASTFSTPDLGTPPSFAFCNAAAKRGFAFGSGERGGFIAWWISYISAFSPFFFLGLAPGPERDLVHRSIAYIGEPRKDG